MIDWYATLRRLALASAAIAVSGVLCHGEISMMLVERGDSVLGARSGHALHLYRRALWFDARNRDAADRLIFAEMLSHEPAALRDAVATADAFLRRDPADLDIRFDRALCNQIMHRYGVAASDFEVVGQRRRDARALLFAADDRARLGNSIRAVALLREAHGDEPDFLPVQRKMKRLAAR